MTVTVLGEGLERPLLSGPTTAGPVTIGVARVSNGVTTSSKSSSVADLACSAGNPVMIKLRTTDTATSGVDIPAKVWRASGPEPAGWNATATDVAGPALTAAGSPGVAAYLSNKATNAPVVVSFSDLTVREPSR